MSGAILPMPPYEWQKPQWNDFYERIVNDTLPHAFMVVGQEGIGVDALAMAMGQYLLCLSPLKNVACGRCRGCQLMQSETHPDLLILTPEEKGKQIKVDQIRKTGDFVNQTAQQGGYKVVVLSPTEAMNINAANALLKNLEEPAGKTVFILVANQLNQVLPTIRSRCAKISLTLPSSKDALAWLSSIGIDDAEDLLEEAMGAPILAKQWCEGGIMEERRDFVRGLAQIADRAIEPLVFAKKWSNYDPLMMVNILMRCVDILIKQKMADQGFADYYSSIVRALEACPTQILFRMRERLCEQKSYLLASANLNPALFVEELTLDWHALTNTRR